MHKILVAELNVGNKEVTWDPKLEDKEPTEVTIVHALNIQRVSAIVYVSLSRASECAGYPGR